jgi:hypothetical protein
MNVHLKKVLVKLGGHYRKMMSVQIEIAEKNQNLQNEKTDEHHDLQLNT